MSVDLERATWSVPMAVAANLQRARKERGWNQSEACRALGRYLDKPWSVATYSLAERSVDGTRVRRFAADELAAMALAFGQSISYFFSPDGPRVLGSEAASVSANSILPILDRVVGERPQGREGEDAPLTTRDLRSAAVIVGEAAREVSAKLSAVNRTLIAGADRLEEGFAPAAHLE